MSNPTPLAGLAAGTIAFAAAAASAQSLPGQFLLIPDSGSDTVGAYSAVDGSLLQADFITDANDADTYNFSTPKGVVQAGDEIFVSDQIGDFLAVFDLQGNYKDTISGGLDNIRGLAAIGDTLYVANGGSANAAPGPAVVTVSASGRAVTGSFARDGLNPFDVAAFDGNLLVSDIENDDGGGEGVLLFAPDGTFLGQPVSSDTTDAAAGPDFPQQVAPTADGGFLVGGFSPPSGVYEFDADGTFTDLYAEGGGQRGVFELLNGDYLYTNGGGTFVLDPTTDTSTLVGPGTQYIGLVTVPEPAGLTVLGLVGLGLLRRRRDAARG